MTFFCISTFPKGALKIFTTNCRSSVLCALPPVAGLLEAAEAAKQAMCAHAHSAHTDPAVLLLLRFNNTKLLLLSPRIWDAQPRAPGAGSRAAARLGRIAGDGATTTRHHRHSCPIFQVISVHKCVDIHPNVPQTVLDLMSRGCARWERFTGFYAVLHGKHRQSSAAVRYPASHIYLSGSLMTIWQIVRKSAGQIYHTKF